MREADFDHAGRPTQVTLPEDPDHASTPPVIEGLLEYNARGLPASASVAIDEDPHVVVESIEYLRDGLVSSITYGDTDDGTGTGIRAPTVSQTSYDVRRRPTRMWATREATDGEDALDDVTVLFDQQLGWDAASNLVAIVDHRDPAEWGAGTLPQSVAIRHDGLYRVTHADYDYTQADGSRAPTDQGTDWRDAQLGTQWADPMYTDPAPMASVPPTERVMTQTWSWDYLANQTETTDDQGAFYERSLGLLQNGDDDDAAGTERPSALYFAQNVETAGATDQAGWLQADYGVGGNLVALTVHAQCHAAGSSSLCSVTETASVATQIGELAEVNCECEREQHYVYRWDELNRLAEARRYDRENLGSWTLATRQRYRYDGANQRTIKQTIAQSGCVTPPTSGVPCERTALYVYPGDFERRGLLRGTSSYDADTTLGTETQYVVAGARMVFRSLGLSSAEYLRDERMVVGIGDLIGTTSAAFDVRTGRLVEASTYYPNGARETLVSTPVAATEPNGFTGKEADEEVGVVYFGERYLVPRLGRWASPDPLHVHAVGGGEALNSYHYVGGNLLQARDPLGLEVPEVSRPPRQQRHFDGSIQAGNHPLWDALAALGRWLTRNADALASGAESGYEASTRSGMRRVTAQNGAQATANALNDAIVRSTPSISSTILLTWAGGVRAGPRGGAFPASGGPTPGRVRLFHGTSSSQVPSITDRIRVDVNSANPGRRQFGAGFYLTDDAAGAEAYAEQAATSADDAAAVVEFVDVDLSELGTVLDLTAGEGQVAWRNWLAQRLPNGTTRGHLWRTNAESRGSLFDAFLRETGQAPDVVVAPHEAGRQVVVRSQQAADRLHGGGAPIPRTE